MAMAWPANATIAFPLGRKSGQIAPVAPRMRLWLTAGTTRALVLSCKRSLLEVTCPDLLRRPRTCVGRTSTHIASVGAYTDYDPRHLSGTLIHARVARKNFENF